MWKALSLSDRPAIFLTGQTGLRAVGAEHDDQLRRPAGAEVNAVAVDAAEEIHSIVVFDRVRENLRSLRRDTFDAVVNTSVNQTLARTIITSGTTGFAVLALFLFGGEVLRGFAFTMLVGVVSGTYSTIFIAASVAIVITERRAERSRRASMPASSSSSRQGIKTSRAEHAEKRARPSRSKRPGRKARAS